MAGEISFSGLASGIDSSAIIEATIAARRAQLITPLTKKVTANNDQNDAITEINSKLLALFNSLKSKTSAFGSIATKKVDVVPANAANITAANNAPVMSAQFTVTQLATQGRITFNSKMSSNTEPLIPSLPGPDDTPELTIKVSLGNGENKQEWEIPINNTTSMQSLSKQINEITNGKITGTVINTGTSANPEYTLTIQGAEEGTDKGTIALEFPAEINSALGVDPSTLYTTYQAKDAIIELDGIGTITRSSNKITDVFPGITIELKEASSTPIKFTAETDLKDVKDTVKGIVDQINEIIKYSKENSTISQTTTSSGSTALVYSSLAKTRIDEELISSIKTKLQGITSGEEMGNVRILADLGITTNKDGTLSFNESKFEEAYKTNPTSAERLTQNLVDGLGNTGSILNEYSKFGGILLTNITTTESSNKQMQERIEQLEQLLSDQAMKMKLMFARLEQITSNMQSAQSALTSALASITSSSK